MPILEQTPCQLEKRNKTGVSYLWGKTRISSTITANRVRVIGMVYSLIKFVYYSLVAGVA